MLNSINDFLMTEDTVFPEKKIRDLETQNVTKT